MYLRRVCAYLGESSPPKSIKIKNNYCANVIKQLNKIKRIQAIEIMVGEIH